MSRTMMAMKMVMVKSKEISVLRRERVKIRLDKGQDLFLCDGVSL